MIEHISPSALDLLSSCPRKFQYARLEHLQETDEDDENLNFGSAWHKIMAAWASGYLGVAEQVVRDYQDPAKGYKTKEKLILAVEHYRQRYGGPPKPIAVEQEFNISLPGIVTPIKGIVDSIAMMDVNEGAGIEKWFIDYKTTGYLESKWVQLYRVSNQFKCYYRAGLEEHPDAAGVLVDILHVTRGLVSEKGQKGKSKAEIDGVHLYRLPIRYTKFALDEWEENVKGRLAELELYETRKFFPMNAPKACGAFNRVCPFIDICDAQNPELRERIIKSFVPPTVEE